MQEVAADAERSRTARERGGETGEGVGEMVVKYPDEKLESGEAAMSVREHLQEIYRRLEFLESAFQKEEPTKVDGS